MSDFIGYKQHIEHFNTKPDIKNRICGISGIVTKYQTLDGKKSYYFDVIVNKDKSITRLKHSYCFDTLDKANAAHSEIRTKYYDQQTKPYLAKIEKGKKLSFEDKEKILEILNKF